MALRAIDAYSAGVRYGTEEFKQNVYKSHRQVKNQSGEKKEMKKNVALPRFKISPTTPALSPLARASHVLGYSQKSPYAEVGLGVNRNTLVPKYIRCVAENLQEDLSVVIS